MGRLRQGVSAAFRRFFRDGEGATVTFETPEEGVAPGQACVLYHGSRVLGGGWIAATGSAS